MEKIERLIGREILDSRGRPTVWACCTLTGGVQGSASVPSGASTGAAEALELRDGDPGRYCGLGCRKAVGHVDREIATALVGRSFEDQAELDRTLIALDGEPSKSRLGANAILAVSLAFARATAQQRGLPLYRHFADLVGRSPARLPRPTVNLYSGGKHAGGQVSIQDVLIVPAAAQTMDEALATTHAVYQSAAELVRRKYAMRPLTADEGGLAPEFPSAQAMLEDAVEAIQAAGFLPGVEVALAIDAAASHFHHDGRYLLDGESLNGPALIEKLVGWVEQFPIVSVEDGLDAEDWEHWPRLYDRLDGRALVLGDDLLCTNPDRIRMAIEAKAANALLLKVNQIGTLTEAAEAETLARSAGWMVTISARSGETEDDWLADLAVGWAGDQIKVGSITQSERLAKYNRLLAIEHETGLPVVDWPR